MCPFCLIAERAFFYLMPTTYPALTTVLPTQYYELEPEYAGARTIFQDGGADYVSLSDTPIRRWAIVYETLTTTERDLFKTLANDSKYSSHEGSLLGFTFTPRGESALSGVHLDEGGYQAVSKKSWIHTVTIRLIHRP